MDNASLVLALEERRRQALLAGNFSELQLLLADDLCYVHSNGACDGKDSYLGKLSSGSLKYLELNFSGLQVQQLMQSAVVRGRLSAVISRDGQHKLVESLFMTVWSCGTDGAWRLHAHQGTPVPESRDVPRQLSTPLKEPRLPYADPSMPVAFSLAQELTKARGGRLLNVDLTLLHSPDLARASRELFRVIRNTFEIPDKLRELAICRVAVVTRCAYEWHQHAPIAIAAGITQEQLNALSQQEAPKGFDTLEDLVIRLTDTMSREIQVSQDLFNNVRKHFNEKQIVELVAIIASYNYLSRFLEALEVQVEN